jgi:hypothetical protein
MKKKIIKKIDQINSNIVRFFINDVIGIFISSDIKQKLMGMYYGNLHIAIMFLGICIILFSNNLFYLIILLLIISIDAFTLIIIHDCPLTMLEKKYLGTSIVELRKKMLKRIGILYNCDHVYECQLEFIINIASTIIFKILMIIFMKLFNVKIISNSV